MPDEKKLPGGAAEPTASPSVPFDTLFDDCKFLADRPEDLELEIDEEIPELKPPELGKPFGQAPDEDEEEEDEEEEEEEEEKKDEKGEGAEEEKK